MSFITAAKHRENIETNWGNGAQELEEKTRKHYLQKPKMI